MPSYRNEEGVNMGAYLQGGICYNIIIYKPDFEDSNLEVDKVLRALDEKIDMSLYNKKESEKIILYVLKEEVLIENIEDFLKTQFQFYNLEDELKEEVLNPVRECEDFEELVSLAKKRNYDNLGHGSVLEHIYVDSKYDIRVCYECITFFKEGKMVLENNTNFLVYLEDLIKISSKYNKLGSTVKVFIE